MFFFFKQKPAYEMRMSDWSSGVCSSDLGRPALAHKRRQAVLRSAARCRRRSDRTWRRRRDGVWVLGHRCILRCRPGQTQPRRDLRPERAALQNLAEEFLGPGVLRILEELGRGTVLDDDAAEIGRAQV